MRAVCKYLRLARAFFCKKRALNLIKSLVAYSFRNPEARPFPVFIQIEPTNRCDLKCPLCLTGNSRLKRSKGDMGFESFKKILDELGDTAAYLVLYNLGEPLLNKDIFKMIGYAKEKRIYVRLSTNGYFNDMSVIKGLVKARLDELVVSLDCPDKESFLSYKGIDGFDTVKNNIKEIIKERGKKNTPFVSVQLLAMRQTENRVADFKKIAAGLGADRVMIKPVRVNFPGGHSSRQYLPLKARYIREAYKGKRKANCLRLWVSAGFLWDGSVVPCCFDMEGEQSFGNIRESAFKTIWNSQKYASFRSRSLHNPHAICRECSLVSIF